METTIYHIYVVLPLKFFEGVFEGLYGILGCCEGTQLKLL